MKHRKCPVCKKTVKGSEKIAGGEKYFPFCSERCKLIDLGAWFDSEYKVISPLPDEDSEDKDK